MAKLQKTASDQKGLTLIVVIFGVIFLALIGLAMNLIVSTLASRSLSQLQSTQAFYIAEGGRQYILTSYFTSALTDYTSCPTVSNKALGLGQFTVSYPGGCSANSATVQVVAQVGSSQRTVRQTVSRYGYSLTNTFAGGDITLFGRGTVGQNPTDRQSLAAHGSIDNVRSFLSPGFQNPDSTLLASSQLLQNQTSLVIPPAVTMTPYLNLTTSNYSGNLNIPAGGTYNGNVHVTGNVTVGQNATVNGIVVSDNDVLVLWDTHINGTIAAGHNLTAIDLRNSQVNSAPGPNGETLPVFVAGNNLYMGTGSIPDTHANINGYVLSGDDTQFISLGNATLTFNGLAMALDDILAVGAIFGDIDIITNPDLVRAVMNNGASFDLSQWKEQ